MTTIEKKQLRTLALIAAAILLLDQAVKFWVKLHMQIGEDIPLIGTWCHLHFTENNGFAFGMSLGGVMGKVLLSVLRIVAVAFIGWLTVRLVRLQQRRTLILSITLIFAGALGNIIDSCFYGLIFNESYYQVATIFPAEGGYAPLLQGKVVDMFYFPLFEFDWPMWMPFVGGKHFEFFDAIFNVADSAVTIGVILLLIDQIFLSANSSKSQVKENSDERK